MFIDNAEARRYIQSGNRQRLAERNGHLQGTFMQIDLTSVFTCPHCGFQKEEMMPTDSCQIFHECTNCKTVLRPKTGDCCVFCSYGTLRCPSKQGNEGHSS